MLTENKSNERITYFIIGLFGIQKAKEAHIENDLRI